MQPIAQLVAYCGNGNPVILEAFSDRWRRQQTWRKRASISWLRKLKAQGVTHVAVEVAPGRGADFTVAELLKASA